MMIQSSIFKEGTKRLRLPSLLSEELGLFGALGTSRDARRSLYSSSKDVDDVSSRIIEQQIEEVARQLVRAAPQKSLGRPSCGGNPWRHYASRFSYSIRSIVTRGFNWDGTFASQIVSGTGAKGDPVMGKHAIHTSSMMCDTEDGSKKKKPTRRRRTSTTSSNEDARSGELAAADEEPFSAITDKIPQRPMTVVEGTSYTLVIIAALGFAAAVLYAALSELVFSPKEYTCFSHALKRIEDDPRVTIRLGTPLSAYGTESRNRSARQRVPHRIYNDDQGREHVQIQFHAKGPSGRATVHADMYQEDGSWKYHYLYLNVESPLPQQVVLIRPFQPDNE